MTYRFLDAAVCYGNSVPGESIPALLLVDGWKIPRLLILIGFCRFNWYNCHCYWYCCWAWYQQWIDSRKLRFWDRGSSDCYTHFL